MKARTLTINKIRREFTRQQTTPTVDDLVELVGLKQVGAVAHFGKLSKAKREFILANLEYNVLKPTPYLYAFGRRWEEVARTAEVGDVVLVKSDDSGESLQLVNTLARCVDKNDEDMFACVNEEGFTFFGAAHELQPVRELAWEKPKLPVLNVVDDKVYRLERANETMLDALLEIISLNNDTSQQLTWDGTTAGELHALIRSVALHALKQQADFKLPNM